MNLRQQRSEEQEDNTCDLDESQIFIEADVGARRDRIYGIGSVASLYDNNSGATSEPTHASAPSAEYTAQLEQRVESLQQQYGSLQEEITDLRQQLNQQGDERLRELIREMLPNLSANQTTPTSESRPPGPQA
ncbi:hypothetical protein M5689_007216 [Euphorbia peplus]|nr:hypothetical protein M5689_007216 [Euphorbia peplus]